MEQPEESQRVPCRSTYGGHLWRSPDKPPGEAAAGTGCAACAGPSLPAYHVDAPVGTPQNAWQKEGRTGFSPGLHQVRVQRDSGRCKPVPRPPGLHEPALPTTRITMLISQHLFLTFRC